MKVSSAQLKSSIESVGRVEQPEAQLATVPARVGGRIDKLYVQFTGENVRRGQAVAEIYSPELVASAEEYRLALQNRDRMRGSGQKEAVESSNDLVAASRRRLELWGVSEKQIDAAGSGSAGLHVTIYAPAGGSVVERRSRTGPVRERRRYALYRGRSEHVWVKADVYEEQVPQIRPGQKVEITLKRCPTKFSTVTSIS